MTKLFKTTALALAASSVALTALPAEAQSRGGYRYEERYGGRYDNRYDNRYDSRYRDRYSRDEPVYRDTRVWRDNGGRYYCRKQDGTTGLLIGGAAGALLGREVDGGRDRTLGTVIGGVLGALVGQQVAGGTRCR